MPTHPNLNQVATDLGAAFALSAASSGAMLIGPQIASDFGTTSAVAILALTWLIAAGLFAMAGPFFGRAGAEFFRGFPRWTGFLFGLLVALTMTGAWHHAAAQAGAAVQETREARS